MSVGDCGEHICCHHFSTVLYRLLIGIYTSPFFTNTADFITLSNAFRHSVMSSVVLLTGAEVKMFAPEPGLDSVVADGGRAERRYSSRSVVC